MRILYISNDPGIPFNGRKGCSTHVRETCYSLIDAGHEVLVSTPTVGDDKFARPINIQSPPYFKSKKLGFDMRLYLSNWLQKSYFKKLIKEFRPDAIYERYSLYSWVGSWLEKKYRIPRIVEINAPMAKQHNDRLRFSRLAQKIEENLLREAGAVIAISEPLKQYLVQIGVKSENVEVMPIAVDPNLFNPNTPGGDVRAKYNLQNKTVFGYVGAFNYYHGINYLYEIARHFEEKKLDAVLLIVGGEDFKVEKHKGKVSDSGLDKYVILTGSVSYRELPTYLSAMDVTMIFGHTNYASPTKLFEYASMKKPIIAPDFPPIRNIVDHGKDADRFLFDPDKVEDMIEKIDYIYHHPEIRPLLIEQTYTRVLESHTWESNTRRVIEMFEHLKSLPFYSQK